MKHSKPMSDDQQTNDQQNSEHFAEIEIDQGAIWGEQTQRSLKYFNIGKHTFEPGFISALVVIKRASAQVNHELKLLSKSHFAGIIVACDELLQGKHADQFPLRVWQTGSGTQTNMNVNEVIATLANTQLEQRPHTQQEDEPIKVHPNDHVNMSQSSNDVFPSAMHIVVAQQTRDKLLHAIDHFDHALANKAAEFKGIYTVGRTHIMDALPLSADALLTGYQSQLASAKTAILESLNGVYQLALGGTAVGSGANAPTLFGHKVISWLAEHYQLPFSQHPNLYAAVSGEEALQRYSGALKQLAATLLKIANDFRLLGSGPRCGLNEWHLPAKEPGSSIMPGKVNPTQCEALSMVCLQVFGNDLTVSLAASNGQLQLNTYRPVIIHNVLESIDLLVDAMTSFAENAIAGLQLNQPQLNQNMQNNLSAITLIAPKLGYDVATEIVHRANNENESLAAASEALGFLKQNEFEALLKEQLAALKIER